MMVRSTRRPTANPHKSTTTSQFNSAQYHRANAGERADAMSVLPARFVAHAPSTTVVDRRDVGHVVPASLRYA